MISRQAYDRARYKKNRKKVLARKRDRYYLRKHGGACPRCGAYRGLPVKFVLCNKCRKYVREKGRKYRRAKWWRS